MSDEELANRNGARVLVDDCPGYPCRVSLMDAQVGETVLLLNFEHQAADSPYRASHAIYVREHAKQAFPNVGDVPLVLQRRLISVRAFNSIHHMVAADVMQGSSLSDALPTMLRDPDVRYIHLHNARPGCFAARVSRA